MAAEEDTRKLHSQVRELEKKNTSLKNKVRQGYIHLLDLKCNGYHRRPYLGGLVILTCNRKNGDRPTQNSVLVT